MNLGKERREERYLVEMKRKIYFLGKKEKGKEERTVIEPERKESEGKIY